MSYYPIQLDKSRNFRYGMRAISLVEKKLKKPISKVNFDEITMEESAILIWAGLQHEDKELTPEKVMDIIDDYSSISAVLQEAGHALNEAFGTTGEKSDEKNV
jgi:hypothetical protein